MNSFLEKLEKLEYYEAKKACFSMVLLSSNSINDDSNTLMVHLFKRTPLSGFSGSTSIRITVLEEHARRRATTETSSNLSFIDRILFHFD